MPAKNPRLTITLKPTLSAQLRRMSELTGNSQASLISELLEGSEPIFANIIRVLEAANEAKGELRGKLAADLDIAQEKLSKQLGLALDTFDSVGQDMVSGAEEIKRRARRGGSSLAGGSAPRAVATPPSNRGVRSTNPKTKVRKGDKNHGPV